MEKLTLDILKACGAEPCIICRALTYAKHEFEAPGNPEPCHDECFEAYCWDVEHGYVKDDLFAEHHFAA